MFNNPKVVRVYDTQGREKFMRPGQIVPIGWFDGQTMEVFQKEMVVDLFQEEGNPYEQCERKRITAYLKEKV